TSMSLCRFISSRRMVGCLFRRSAPLWTSPCRVCGRSSHVSRRMREPNPYLWIGMRTSSGVDYDAIAHLYDSQPYRAKAVDPELIIFKERRTPLDRPFSILDIACGTGSQLVANRSTVPEAQMVGLDRSLGMLRQAQSKAQDIMWVQADGACLPFLP